MTPKTNKTDCSEAARRLSEPTYDKPGMQGAFYELARRAYSHVRRQIKKGGINGFWRPKAKQWVNATPVGVLPSSFASKKNGELTFPPTSVTTTWSGRDMVYRSHCGSTLFLGAIVHEGALGTSRFFKLLELNLSQAQNRWRSSDLTVESFPEKRSLLSRFETVPCVQGITKSYQ